MLIVKELLTEAHPSKVLSVGKQPDSPREDPAREQPCRSVRKRLHGHQQ